MSFEGLVQPDWTAFCIGGLSGRIKGSLVWTIAVARFTDSLGMPHKDIVGGFWLSTGAVLFHPEPETQNEGQEPTTPFAFVNTPAA